MRIMEQSQKKRGRKIQWTPERVDKICDSIRRGSSYKDAYTVAGVPKSTFYDHLLYDSDFLDRVKKAEQEYQDWFDSELVVSGKRGLMDLVQGYVQKTTKTKTIKDKSGKTVEETIVEEKQMPPNATAIIFALCNRAPEQWSNKHIQELTGKIETESKPGITLAKVPDDLLAKVIEAIGNERPE